MALLIHLSPVLLVMSMLIVLRRPPVHAAMAGAGLVAVLWLVDGLMASAAIAALKDTAVLFASTAFVIVPGLAFVIFVERMGVNQALSEWVQSLALKRAELVVFIVLGLAPLLEAMTGFGVSLIATVPLLLSLFERRAALRVALTGMAIMPWGTLGLATVMGASLAHVEINTLAATSALTSAPVFIVLAALAACLCGVGVTRASVGLGIMFVAVLYTLSRWLGPEVAGIGAGSSVALATLLMARRRRQGAMAPAWPRAAWPYLGLIICIALLKGLNALTHLENAWVVTGMNVTWKPLASPGVALLLVLALVWVGKAGGDGVLSALTARARRPLLTILFFLAMSQMMVKAGFLDGLVQALGDLPNAAAAPLVALLGGLSGYMTGSNVGGNAIFMPAVALLPESSRWLLAAMQNSAAGHAALGSLSIVMLVLGLAKTRPEEEGQLVRFGFALACLNTVLVALAGRVLLWVG